MTPTRKNLPTLPIRKGRTVLEARRTDGYDRSRPKEREITAQSNKSQELYAESRQHEGSKAEDSHQPMVSAEQNLNRRVDTNDHL